MKNGTRPTYVVMYIVHLRKRVSHPGHLTHLVISNPCLGIA